MLAHDHSSYTSDTKLYKITPKYGEGILFEQLMLN